MIFTVTWSPRAEQTLAGLWVDAPDRRAVKDAADQIDAVLRRRPLDIGESRTANIRILTVLPLTAYYEVREADRRVIVWSVLRVGRR
jgi:hypothetical protein